MADAGAPREPDTPAVVMDAASRTAVVAGHGISLTRSEYALLHTLVTHADQAMSSHGLLSRMWGTEWTGDTTALQVHISRLRRKLTAAGAPRHTIVTVHGFGYRFNSRPGESLGLEDLPDLPASVRPGDHHDEQHAPGVLCMLSPTGSVLWVGNHVERLLGTTSTELAGRPFHQLIHAQDEAQWERAMGDVGSTGAGAVVIRMRDHSGEQIPVLLNLRAVMGEDGQTQGILGQCRRLARMERSQETISIDDAGGTTGTEPVTAFRLEFDADFTLVSLDPPQPFLGWAPQEIIGGFFSPSGLDRAALSALTDALLQSGTLVVDGPVALVDRDGRTHVSRVVSTMSLDEDHAFMGLCSMVFLPHVR